MINIQNNQKKKRGQQIAVSEVDPHLHSEQYKSLDHDGAEKGFCCGVKENTNNCMYNKSYVYFILLLLLLPS
jgi:hypothetical protein